MVLTGMGDTLINSRLERWTARLGARSYQALLLLIEGGHSGKQVSLATGVAESNVSRLRTTYERLSGRSLPRMIARASAA